MLARFQFDWWFRLPRQSTAGIYLALQSTRTIQSLLIMYSCNLVSIVICDQTVELNGLQSLSESVSKQPEFSSRSGTSRKSDHYWMSAKQIYKRMPLFVITTVAGILVLALCSDTLL